MTPQEQEIERIAKLADGLGLSGNPYMLPCILLRLDGMYPYRTENDRKTAEELTLAPEFKSRAQQLHRIVGSSDMSNILKHVVCGAVESYLLRIGISDAEMAEFKATSQFDPAKFDLFAGLGPEGN